MSKALKTIATLVLMYMIPLLGNTGLLTDARLIFLMIAGFVMFQSQPELKMSEANEKKTTDRNSMFIILCAGIISQWCALIEWGYFRFHPEIIHNEVMVGIGVVMVVGGMAWRLWAIRTLAGFFTSTVQIKTGHRVIRHGPYRMVRHPSYLGSLVAITGSTFVLEAPIASLVALCSMLCAYWFRVGVEEAALASQLGREYREFQEIRKYKIIPFVW